MQTLPKCPTGIKGLDEVTSGGFPLARPTLICGGPGCGKTLLSIEFLVRGATQFNEPGLMMAFEETAADLAANVRSLGFDLERLIAEKKLLVDYVYLERSEISETGEYDLEGIFVRIAHAINSIGAKRVVLDTLEVLFSGFSDMQILRAEIRRLFRWLKEKGVTAVITAERGEGTLTRFGFEEYVSDCVIMIDHRVTEQVSTRRMRIVKYRGSAHGTNEFPFLIDSDGLWVVPITSAGMNHPAFTDRVSTGVTELDEMLGGKGYLRGTSVLISGTAGTGKTSLAAHFAAAACQRGEKCIYFSFEESPGQLIRNMRSIGLDLEKCVGQGLLKILSHRPSMYGLEMHLALINRAVSDIAPKIVVIDPISNFIAAGTGPETEGMLVRLVDFLKSRGITSLFTNLIRNGFTPEATDFGISSIIDTWVLLRDQEKEGARSGSLFVLKSRGMPHSKHIREFSLSDNGILLGGSDPVISSAR
jgi:circadian clock protein KaiC